MRKFSYTLDVKIKGNCSLYIKEYYNKEIANYLALFYKKRQDKLCLAIINYHIYLIIPLFATILI